MNDVWYYIIFGIVLLIPLLWLLIVNIKDNSMKKHITIGDPVYFYIDEDRELGNYVKRNEEGKFVIQFGKKLQYVDEIYAVFRYKYKR